VLQLVETENIRGVITMNENYETKYFCNSAEVSLPEHHGAMVYCLIGLQMVLKAFKSNIGLYIGLSSLAMWFWYVPVTSFLPFAVCCKSG